MDAQIRAYKITDRVACLAAFESNVPDFFTVLEVNEFSDFLDNFQNKDEGATYFYVVCMNEAVIGCGGFGDKAGDGTLTLAWGHIHKKHHKQGYGKLLLEYRLQQFKKLYPRKLLYVDTTQFSFGFFERFGFEVLSITPDYYTQGMHRYDMLYKETNV